MYLYLQIKQTVMTIPKYEVNDMKINVIFLGIVT